MGEYSRHHTYTVDLNKSLQRHFCGILLAEGDSAGDDFTFALKRDGALYKPEIIPAIVGYFIRPDGVTIELDGKHSHDDGVAALTLDKMCYTCEGRFTLTVKLIGHPSVATAIAIIDGYIRKTTTGTVVTPDGEEDSGSVSWATVPDYWQSHIDERVNDTNMAMAAAAGNRSAFLWYHDAHWTYNYQQSPALLKYLCMNTPIKKVIFGGDIVDAEGDAPADMAYLAEWRDAVRSLPNHHSVVGNHDDGNDVDNRWDDTYIYNFLLAEEETSDIVRGESGLYYYIDSTAEKTRYLYLDTASYDGTILSDKQQQTWLKTALLSTPDGWHIVAVSHIWVKVDYTQSPPVVTGLDTAGKYALDMFDAYNARTGDYASCKGRVEFCIGGHSHVDGDLVSDGGIPVILTECDGRGVRSGLTCTKGTITEQSVNAVIANYTSGIVTIVRIGRGNSRIVKLDGSGSTIIPDDGDTVTSDYELVAPTGNFTNQIKIATDGNGTIYNAYGYKNDTRLSTSSLPASERSESGWDLTGYIPVKPGDVVRFKNLEFYEPTDDTTYDRCGIFVFDQNFSYVAEMVGMTIDAPLSATMSNIKHDANGQLAQFTMTTHWDFTSGYMRICAHDITGASIITVNEEINITE